MEKKVVLSLRLGLRLFHWAVFLFGFYFFHEIFTFKQMFDAHWILPFVAIFIMLTNLFLACSIYVVTEEGVRWMLMLWPVACLPLGRKFTSWYYEILQVRGVFPFYYMFAFEYQDGFALSPNYLPFRFSIPFFFCRNFLDLIIFIDENISCKKMNPEYRERFRQLADKYRRMKSNHPIIYWILNNT